MSVDEMSVDVMSADEASANHSKYISEYVNNIENDEQFNISH